MWDWTVMHQRTSDAGSSSRAGCRLPPSSSTCTADVGWRLGRWARGILPSGSGAVAPHSLCSLASLSSGGCSSTSMTLAARKSSLRPWHRACWAAPARRRWRSGQPMPGQECRGAHQRQMSGPRYSRGWEHSWMANATECDVPCCRLRFVGHFTSSRIIQGCCNDAREAGQGL